MFDSHCTYIWAHLAEIPLYCQSVAVCKIIAQCVLNSSVAKQQSELISDSLIYGGRLE